MPQSRTDIAAGHAAHTFGPHEYTKYVYMWTWTNLSNTGMNSQKSSLHISFILNTGLRVCVLSITHRHTHTDTHDQQSPWPGDSRLCFTHTLTHRLSKDKGSRTSIFSNTCNNYNFLFIPRPTVLLEYITLCHKTNFTAKDRRKWTTVPRPQTLKGPEGSIFNMWQLTCDNLINSNLFGMHVRIDE